MSDHLGTILSLDEITSLAKEIGADIDAERTETAWDKLQTLRRAQRHQRDAASALLHVIDRADFPFEDAAEVVAEVADAHADDVDILASLGDCLEAARDIDDLNAPPPDEAVFGQVFDRLSAAVAEHAGKPEEPALRRGLAIAARMMARQHDDVAEENYRRLLDFDPKNSTSHYNLGLLLSPGASLSTERRSRFCGSGYVSAGRARASCCRRLRRGASAGDGDSAI